MKGILGRKLGMTQVFDANGNAVPVTVVEAGPCVVVSQRTQEKDGYTGLQLGFGEGSEKKLNKPAAGVYKKAGVRLARVLGEVHVDNPEAYSVGSEVTCDVFAEGEKIDVVGTTKGKGFQGAMKRHNFSGGGRSHGSMTHRQPCSGGSTDAARTFKGAKKPGHLGSARCTTQGLTIVRVDKARNLLLIRGSVPGAPNGVVVVKSSSK